METLELARLQRCAAKHLGASQPAPLINPWFPESCPISLPLAPPLLLQLISGMDGPSVEELYLEDNHIPDAGVCALCGSLHLPPIQSRLRVVSLGSCHGGNAIGDTGAIALAKVIDAVCLPAVEKLALDYNSISDDGADALVAALAKEASSPKLRTLSISANRLSDEMIEALHKLSRARTFLLLSRPQLLSELLTHRREWLGE